MHKVMDHVVDNVAQDTSGHGRRVDDCWKNTTEEGNKEGQEEDLAEGWREDKPVRVLREGMVDTMEKKVKTDRNS